MQVIRQSIRVATQFICVISWAAVAHAVQTIGGGVTSQAAVGPGPSFGVGADGNYALVKNWNFGTDSESTITDMSTMSTHFQYHDQFGTIANGTNYGAYIVAPNAATARSGQPIEGINTSRPVREFTTNSLKTYVVPLNGATQVHPTTQKAGSGAFQAKWKAPYGGSRLGHNMIWETRVRYETAPYFWFAIWNSGNQWSNGAEIDVIESFGYNNGGSFTNYDGRYWHSSGVGGTNDENYHSGSWRQHMEARGIFNFDPTQWHTWTLEYRTDDTFSTYVDGIEVQSGTMQWTLGGGVNALPINMSFIFDGTWGHRQVSSVNHTLAASELENIYYEWDYSRIYYSVDPPGDFDFDGDVDGRDFLKWQRENGTSAHLELWQESYGSNSLSAQSVPEPSVVVLALLAFGGLLMSSRKH